MSVTWSRNLKLQMNFTAVSHVTCVRISTSRLSFTLLSDSGDRSCGKKRTFNEIIWRERLKGLSHKNTHVLILRPKCFWQSDVWIWMISHTFGRFRQILCEKWRRFLWLFSLAETMLGEDTELNYLFIFVLLNRQLVKSL